MLTSHAHVWISGSGFGNATSYFSGHLLHLLSHSSWLDVNTAPTFLSNWKGLFCELERNKELGGGCVDDYATAVEWNILAITVRRW
jgi:hypothetical protein